MNSLHGNALTKLSGTPGPPKIAPYRTLEAWRGFASLWVVMYHAANATIVRHPDLAAAPIYAFSRFGFLGVQIFFVVSGYCIATAACNTLRRSHSFRHFMQARLRRIYPPYWFAWFLAALDSALAGLLVKSRPPGSSYSAYFGVLHQGVLFYFSNLTLTQVAFHRLSLVGQAWTLCYEMAFYIIVGLLILIPCLLRDERIFLNAIHAITVITLLFLLVIPQHRFYPMELWPQFGLGAMVYDVIRHGGERRSWGWLLLAFFQVMAFVIKCDLPFGPEKESSRFTFAVSLAFSLLLVALHRFDASLSQWKMIRGLSWIGLFSYSLYLIHFLVIGVLNQIINFLKAAEYLHLLWFNITVVAGVGAGYLFYLLCEKRFVKPILQPAAQSGESASVIGHTAE